MNDPVKLTTMLGQLIGRIEDVIVARWAEVMPTGGKEATID